MSLRLKFAIAVASLVTVVVVAVGSLIVVSERRLLRSEMNRHHERMAERLAQVCEESLYQSELVVFNYLGTLRDERGLLGAGCVNAQGRIQIHSDPEEIGTILKTAREAEAGAASGVFRQRYRRDGVRVLDLAAPFFFGDNRAGTARLFLSPDELDAFIDRSVFATLRRVAAISAIALALGILGAFWLAGSLMKPIHQVIGGMREVAKGRLEPIPFSVRRDELGWIGKELNVTIGRLKELDEMKRDFVSSVTHELRSPLTAIDRYISLLTRGTYGATTRRQSDALVTIQNNTQRLMRFIDDLLATARLETRRVDLYCDRMNLADAIRDAATLYRPLAEEKGLRLVADLPTDDIPVFADREKVTQVLNNLLSNALKFTATGAVMIGVEPSESAVRVTVTDSGPGISDRDRAQVFDKFFRARETANQVKGTGLGLSIVKGLIEAQGGAVGVDPAPGGGSRFWFTLPRK